MPARGVWNGRRISRLVIVLFSLLLLVGVLLRVFVSGPDAVTILGLMIAFIAVVPTWAGLKHPEELHVVARDLARRVEERQSCMLVEILRDADPGSAADIELTSPRPASEPTLNRLHCADGGPATGTLREVDLFFDDVPHSRLVILGNRGAGKTVVAAVFVRDRIRRILANPDEKRFVVPVLLDLASWEPGDADQLADVSTTTLVARLDRWLAHHLEAQFGVDPSDASGLVEGGWILPVLDGLDELDATDDAAGRRPRAAAALRTLNCPRKRPIVLVSRIHDYTWLAERLELAADEPVLRPAKHVIVKPVDPLRAGAYLMGRLAQDSRLEARRTLLRDALDRRSDSFRPELAKAVADPVLLAVLATVGQTNDPTLLLSMSREQIRDYLLTALVPVVTARHPCRPGGRPAQPERVVRWLARIAEPLPVAGRHRWTLNDIRLDGLWPTVGWHLPRFGAALLAALPAAVVGGGVLVALATMLPTTGLIAGGTAVLGGLGLAVHAQVSTRPGTMKYLSLRRLRTAGTAFALGAPVLVTTALAVLAEPVVRLALASPVGPTLADMPVGIVGEPASATFWPGLAEVFTLPYRVFIGAALGLAVGLDIAAEQVRSGHRPSAALRRGMPFDLLFRSLAGAALGVGGGLTVALIWRLEHGPVPSGLPAAFGCLAGAAAVLATSRWLRYSVTTVLGAGRRLPWRPARFLDWGHEAGLFRLSGAASQFRNTEFRQWLQRSRRSGQIR